MGSTPEDPTNPDGTGVRQRRPYAFACDSCKRRKIKCGGERPICSGCTKYREECIWGTHNHNLERKPSINLPPSQSVRVKRRRTSSPPISTTSNPISIPPPASTTPGTSTSVRTPHTVFDSSAESPGLQHLATAATHLARRCSRSPQRSLQPESDEQYEYRRAHAEGSRSGSTMASQTFASGSHPSGTRDHVQFGGPVQSGMREPVYTRPREQVQATSCGPNAGGCTPSTCAPYTSPGMNATTSSRSYDKREQEVQSLRANAKQVRLWEVMAFRNLDRTGPEASVAFHLLETYWCWQQPQYLTVYRPTFLRDMPTPGPYCNPFLINMIYAQALPVAYPSAIPPSFSDMNGAPLQTTTQKDFLDRAKLLLMAEMDKPSSIPTVQGLLILAGSECSRGNSSAGWLYAGMAYRMMHDLGIHLDDEEEPSSPNLSLEEKEVRRTLWWTAYTWDTMMSLVLARSPTWRETGHQSREFPLDDTADDMVWTPYIATDSWAGVPDYPPYRSYGRTTFVWFCRLCRIVNEILTKRYARKSASRIRSADLEHISSLLEGWWRDLPVCLKLEPTNLPEWCPPIHIFSLNLLYRATLIMLHRPGCCSDVPGLDQTFRNICVHAAEEIHQLLLLHGKTFAYRNLPYNVSYCVCLAASVNVSEVRSPDPGQRAASKSRLDTALQVLETGRAKTPGISRCIDILRAYSASQGHQTLATNPTGRYNQGLPSMQINGPMSISHLGSSAASNNYVPLSGHGTEGILQQAPGQPIGDLSLLNDQPDPLSALLTTGLDMPDGDLWNWLAFAEMS